MKGLRILTQTAVWLAVVGFCIPTAVLAAPPAAQEAVDVALREGGVLLGQVVDPQGAAIGDAKVALVDGQNELAVAKTRGDGYFAFSGLRGGVYQVAAANGQGVYRVWAPGTAPPSAEQGALVVAGGQTVRGQAGGLMMFLSNPWVIAGIVATAVAVPVAVHNSSKSSTGS